MCIDELLAVKQCLLIDPSNPAGSTLNDMPVIWHCVIVDNNFRYRTQYNMNGSNYYD